MGVPAAPGPALELQRADLRYTYQAPDHVNPKGLSKGKVNTRLSPYGPGGALPMPANAVGAAQMVGHAPGHATSEWKLAGMRVAHPQYDFARDSISVSDLTTEEFLEVQANANAANGSWSGSVHWRRL